MHLCETDHVLMLEDSGDVKWTAAAALDFPYHAPQDRGAAIPAGWKNRSTLQAPGDEEVCAIAAADQVCNAPDNEDSERDATRKYEDQTVSSATGSCW